MANPFLQAQPQGNPFLQPQAAPQQNPFLRPESQWTAPATAAKVGAYEEANPFWTRIGQRFKKGALELEQGGAGIVGTQLSTQSTQMLDAMDKVDRGEAYDQSQFQPAELEAIRGYQESPPVARGQIRNTLLKQYGEAAQPIVDLQKRIDAIPSSPALQGIAENWSAGNYNEAAKILMQNPLSTMGQFGVESLPQVLPAIAAGAAAGLPAAAAVMGGTAGAQEFGSSVVDFLGKQGVDTNNPEALAKAFADPGLMAKAKDYATKRAAVAVPGNALAALTGGVSLVPEKMFQSVLAKEAANVFVAQPLTQAAIGGGTEAGSQLAAEGEITDPTAIMLNALGEFAGAPIEAVGLGAGRIAGLLSPDRGAPLSERATLDLLRGVGNETATNPPRAPEGRPPEAEPSVSETEVARPAESSSREQSTVTPGNNTTPLRLEDLPATAKEVVAETAKKEAVAQVKQAIAKRNLAQKFAEEGKSEQAQKLRMQAETHLQKAVEQGYGQAVATERKATAQQTATETPNSPAINVLPPDHTARALYRGYGRQDQGTVYNGANVPILGPGRYYALNAETARNFGPNLETRTAEGLKPLIISSDQQWRELTREAGWEFPNPFGMAPDQIKVMTERLRSLIQQKGYDSVAVSIPKDVRTDFNSKGEPIKTLRKVFGDSQIVAYDNAQEAPHIQIPKGAKTSTKEGSSQFFNLGSFNTNLRKILPGYEPETHAPGEVRVVGEPGQTMAEVNKVTAFIKELSSKFLKGAKVVIATGQNGWLARNATDRGFLGQFFGTADGTVVIWVSPEVLSANNQFQSVQVLAHEFGHAVAWWNWYNTPSDVQQAIMGEYQDYLIRSAGMRPEEAIAETQSAWALSSLAADSDVNTRVLNGESIDRHAERISKWFDFDEWMAEQFVRWATSDAKPFTIVEKYFKSVADKIKNVFRFFGLDVSKSVAAPVMTAWFRSIQEKHEAMMPSSTPFAMLHSQLKGVRQVASELNEDWGIDGPAVSPATSGIRPLFRQMKIPVRQAAAIDKFNWWINKTWGLLQIADKNPHIQGLRNFVEAIRNFHISKMALVSRADGRLRDWRKLGKSMGGSLSNFLFDVDSMSYLARGQNARWPTNAELVVLAQKHGLNQEAMQLYLDIKGDFAHVLDKMEAAWLRDAQASITDPAQLWQAIQSIHSEMGALRSRPYFPHERFGDWTLTARDAAGKTVFFQQFANRRSAVQAGEQYARANPGQDVTTGRMPREVAQFRGLPPTLMRSIASRLNLSAVQQRMLDDLILDLSPANSAAKRFKKRTGTPGYSMDAMRAYAHYFLTMSGWLARLEYGEQMRVGIKDTQQSAMAMRGVYAADAVHKRLGIAEWMQRTFDYLNDGRSEWQGLRSFAFLWYLGYNVSSAMVNLTQVPMVALPYLSGRFNDLEATRELSKAYSNIRGNYLMKASGHTPELQQALTEAINQGFIDESMAAELASASSGGTLQAMLPGTKLQRGLMNFANVGSVPFKMMEKLNRRVVFQAAFRLAQKAPNTRFLHELETANPDLMGQLRSQGWTDVNARAFLAARDAIEKSQFEYAKWARPEFMRGKKAVLFTFFMFKQNMLWFLKNGPGAGRAWVMLLLAAGVMGLPGADHLNDLIKFLTKQFGGGYFNPELELRKLLVDQLHADPDLVLHGLGYHTLGMSILGDALGVPVPDVDLSSRLGMQQLIPGVEPILAINRDSFDERFGKAAEQVLGAGVNVPIGVLKAVASGDPNKFKQIERGLPTAFKNFARAYRWLDQGETTRGGAEIASFDINDTRGRMDVFAQALGFTPTYMAAKRELAAQQMEAATYWGLRRSELFEQFALARIGKDKEGLAAAQEAIREYNRTAPNGKLKITAADLRENLKSRLKRNAKIAGGQAPTKGMQPVYRQLEGLYPSSEGR